jgi:hypothetical protein
VKIFDQAKADVRKMLAIQSTIEDLKLFESSSFYHKNEKNMAKDDLILDASYEDNNNDDDDDSFMSTGMIQMKCLRPPSISEALNNESIPEQRTHRLSSSLPTGINEMISAIKRSTARPSMTSIYNKADKNRMSKVEVVVEDVIEEEVISEIWKNNNELQKYRITDSFKKSLLHQQQL